MLNIQLAKKYAAAMFELAQDQNKLALCDKQLTQICELFNTNHDLQAFMDNPQVNITAKKNLIKKILTDEFEPSITNFLLLLIDKHRIILLTEIITSFHTLSNEAQGIQIAYVKTALPLSTGQEEALKKKLEVTTEKTIQLQTRVDKSILGGIIVKINDRVIDGSVVSQLKTIEKQLVTNC